MFKKFNSFLDRFVLPIPVRFVTFRFVIVATMLLLIPMVVFASNQLLVLSVNSYLNTMSMAVSSIVLLYSTLAERRQAEVAKLTELRAQEDHDHLTEMHTLLMQTLAREREQLEDLKEMAAQAQGHTYQREAPAPEPNLELMHARGEARYTENDSWNRVEEMWKATSGG